MASKLLDVRFSSALKASLPICIIFFAAIAFTILLPELILWLLHQVFPRVRRLLQVPVRTRIHLSVAA
jgi:TRAP-type C4-dicarboxylate transport system permease large subunit